MMVTLSAVWVVNVTTGDMLGAQSDPARTYSSAVEGAVRKYAGGRLRAVGSLGQTGAWKLTLVELTLTQVQQLESWSAQGATVFVRDARGQAMYGTIFQVDRGENFGVWPNATYTAGFEVDRVDVVEGV